MSTHRNDTSAVPAAACRTCGGWRSSGGMAQHAHETTPVMGRTGCTCNAGINQLPYAEGIVTTASAFVAGVRAIQASPTAEPLIAAARAAHGSLPAVALAALAGTDRRVRLFLGDPETGRDWGEENDVTGYVGRSTGPSKVPLLLATRRSMGGGAILVDCVLRMLVDGCEI